MTTNRTTPGRVQRGLMALRVALGEDGGTRGAGGMRGKIQAAPFVVQSGSEDGERQAQNLQKCLEYWRSKLDSLPGRLELPADRPRAAQQIGTTATESLVLPQSTADALHSVSQRENVDLFVLMLALFKILLSRYSGQEDVCVGSLFTCASGFVNTVALRTDLSGDPTFRELLARVKNTTLEAGEHSGIPFEMVIRELWPDCAADSFFQVLFSLGKDSGSSEGLAGSSPVDVSIAARHVDLECVITPKEEGLAVAFNYRSDALDPSIVPRMLVSFRSIVEAVIDHPDQRLSSLPVLSDEERHQILVEWNKTEAHYPADKCIHQLIEAQAERTPDAIAIQHEDETLTYREFNERANQLARHLRKLGVGPDTPVGICLEPSLSLTLALLAVLKANGACLPLDPAYPKDRLQYMVEDARIPVLVSTEQLASDLAGSHTKVVPVDSVWESIAKESRTNLDNRITPENLAYVIYTSGSTGKPKGVMLIHRGLVNYITAAIKIYGLTSSDRQLQFSSISFDIAIEEMLPTWVAGAALVLRSGDFSLAGPDFLGWARRQKLTILSVATAYWHELVHELVETNASLPESIRLLVVGGEKAQEPTLEAWRKVGGERVRWVNTYGPTETSVIATSYELPLSGMLPSPLPIGRPVNNTLVYILDRNLQPVPAGVAGEVHIAGPGLARGYLNSPDLTATKFVPDPFSLDRGGRLYKTGDLARHLQNGEIEFLGRRDFQVKIRGFRVEPGEIEAVLVRHSSVREAVVLVQDEGNSGKRLVAYIVPVRGMTPSAGDLRNSLKGQLPDYMVPSSFVFFNELPLTPNGKVDRRALLAMPADHTPTHDYAAPTDAVESKLADIWGETLGKRPIGVRDNFFELGGHSLIAVRLMRRIEQEFHRTLPLVTLFEAPTVEQMAAIVRRDGWSPHFSLVIPIQPHGNRPPFFCVHGLGGAVLRFQDLARHMAPDQPFYGIQPQGIDGEMPFLYSVEAMATCYVTEMRKIQPEGPYFLGGYSFGGLVAFQMARQLQASGHEVAFLGLIDTYPGKAKSNAVLLSTLLALPRKQQIAYITRKVDKYRKGLRRRFDALFLPKPLKEVRKILAKAELAYQPQAYFGTTTWLRAREKGLRGLDNPQDDWSAWAVGGVEIHEIDGDHGSIMKEPMVGILADKLRSCLAKAQEKSLQDIPVTLEACR